MATDYRKYILSTGTHWISNSGSDENGGIKGGRAGDQSGKEWRLRGWYNRPWTCVLRWPDINAATLIAQLGIDAALNDKIGYDQGQRDSFWKEVKKVGWLPAKIRTACEEDCTAGVNGLVHCAAYLLGIGPLKAIPETGIRSGNMRAKYRAAGFRVLTEAKYLKNGDYLLPGDILLYDNHHGATNVTVGRKMRGGYAYHDVIDNLEKYRGEEGTGNREQGTGDEGTGNSEQGTGMAGVLERGDSGEAVKAMQELLLRWNVNCLPEYGPDGDFGKETEDAVKAFQKSAKLEANGIYDAATDAALKNVVCGHVKITGNRVNVRAEPGTAGRDIGTVHRGDLLIYQGIAEEAEGKPWYLVIYDSANGWVSSKYAELVD